ncbi:MAG: SDR family oxidoreductase [Verrucomicrobiota bacterium]
MKPRNLIFGISALLLATRLLRWLAAKATYSFQHKVVLITGGSRGLGLALARRFAREGARIAIVARDHAELLAAKSDLERCGAEAVFPVVCNLRDHGATEAMVESVAEHFGALDIVVNNAGVIVFGPFENHELSDFELTMDLHAWAPLIVTRAALPHLPKDGTGRIVNISSIGGRIPQPHLSAYNMSKFAGAGLSDALGIELARRGISVTTVAPGLMRTGSHVHAMLRGDHEAEFAWFSNTAALPIFSISAERAARQIVEACRQGRRRLTITWQARAAVIANALLPNTTARALSIVNRMMPAPVSTPTESRSGAESRSRLTPHWLTWLNDRASRRYNEVK